MRATEIAGKIKNGIFDAAFVKLYGNQRLARERQRYISLSEGFIAHYGDIEAELFSVPGRSEISGNHTDHNSGKVIASAVDIDIIAMASKQSGRIIKVKSEFHRDCEANLDRLSQAAVKKGHSSAIVAGVADYFIKNGFNVGGALVYTKSAVSAGSGISSSAAFEVMVGNILNHFYNGGNLSPLDLAKAGKYAENVFFGKPCGLMDQTACAVGGTCYMDFLDQDNIFCEKLDFDPDSQGYSLCIIHTGSDHAKLTDEYASLPAEMKSVASFYKKENLRQVDVSDFFNDIPALRKICGDRAVLRAFHFFNENDRVENQRSAVKAGDYGRFFKNLAESGDSSYKYLQNVFSPGQVKTQGIALALALCGKTGVTARVHGGGFAGTAQAWVKEDQKKNFILTLESVFGKGCLMFVKIRRFGAVKVREDDIC
ncbi:MAG: galactokinase family protein [Eubacteriales bacterium]